MNEPTGRAVACPACGEPTAPLDWQRPGFWYHPDGMLLCAQLLAVRN